MVPLRSRLLKRRRERVRVQTYEHGLGVNPRWLLNRYYLNHNVNLVLLLKWNINTSQPGHD